jgi:hypothetical protein
MCGADMHKNKPSKHKPVLTKKPRNPVVAALVKNPKRNAGRHKAKAEQQPLTMLDIDEKE